MKDKIKVAFYFDWYRGMDLSAVSACAYTKPYGEVALGSKRYKFVVEMDDPAGPYETQEVGSEVCNGDQA